MQLAQYREVEYFASFASDLDPLTLKTLARGVRLIEILKQKRFAPLAVPQQLVLLYAGLQGYLDDLTVEQIPFLKRLILTE